MIFSDVLPQVPWSTTGTFVLGLIGLLAVAALVMNVTLSARKLFGRVPPIHDELEKRDKALRRMIFASEKTLGQRVKSLEERYEDMQLDRTRKWEELTNRMNTIEQTLAFLRGKFESQDDETR